MFRVEKMRDEDFPFATSLANTIGWKMAKWDFEFMSKLEPHGCLVLWQDQVRAGIATCISFGKIGWFGSLAVRKKYRGRGAGSLLLNHALRYLKSKGAETIGLYAYPHLVKFYEKAGFKTDSEFAVFSGKASASNNLHTSSRVRVRDRQSVIEFDKQCFGWDRKRLLNSIFSEKHNLCFLKTDSDELTGFIVAKVYDKMVEIGPLVCRKGYDDVAVELLKNLFSRLPMLDLFACVSAKQEDLIKAFVNAGMREDFQLTRMFLGSIISQSCIYMPESLERG